MAKLIHSLMACATLASASALATPALADSAAIPALSRAARIPAQLDAEQRAFYANVFAQIDAENWGAVESMLAARPDDSMKQLALAEYYLHPNSPRIELDRLNAWLALGRDLPQAGQIGRLAIKRGLENSPDLPGTQRLVSLRTPAKRILPRQVGDATMPAEVSNAILDRIKNDDPSGARILLDGVDATLSSDARAEWRQRVAWSYYIENNDSAALALARTVAAGGSGAWVGEGWWTAGLAAWRLGDCAMAADGFSNASKTAANEELRAASYYWAARAYTRCRQPEQADPALRAAAGYHETLYGMIAAEQLGMTLPTASRGRDFSASDWSTLAGDSNVRTAVALVEIGREGLADEVLRHQAQIGNPAEYEQLTRLARALGLPGTQLYMAYNAPRGAKPDPSIRYPVTRWAPREGWRVDPALAYAHTLQESNFQAGAVSPAGAVGLMQIMPGTARYHAPSLGLGSYDLKDPATNMSFGQRNLEMLRDSGGTQGLLPKIMAAYNAGLSPITRWNSEVRDGGDPLLYMESIPYWETRAYVAIVTKNYLMYRRQAGTDSEVRAALAQNLWPKFPGPQHASAVAQHGKPVLSGATR
ncbi:lytic transglycosylase domain-containing protein [Croceicoccus naphthovorans]|uniref:Lytic murein transglycosylase n=1 Tax=Croceicoccus naphthovorans TaxID=1348774 RepID=A0A0G3XFW9_9SPHN|nr:lytic transglycosylase domain-containing protein [Croceicoccus naphthovorans]AKM10445.1 lytic murein transglycosylase [Croceicoccus naphthovorans]MBB3988615.1 soluble lytic murein transglycosylase-like protein [Croceicoccus naphthovorans]